MLTAVTITATGFTVSRSFYDAVLGALGWVRAAELVDEEEDDAEVEVLGWGPADAAPQLWVVAGATGTTGLHLRLRARSRHEVETFASVADQHGGTVVSGPRRWTIYRQGEFGATVRDPFGNLVEVVAAE